MAADLNQAGMTDYDELSPLRTDRFSLRHTRFEAADSQKALVAYAGKNRQKSDSRVPF